MRIPPISARFCANDVFIPGPYTRNKSTWTLACNSAGNGAALSTSAMCLDRSSLTNLSKYAARARQPRRLDSRTRSTTCRTRTSSRDPLTQQSRNRCLASRLTCLVVFILFTLELVPSSRVQLLGRFLGQAPLIFRRQNLTGDRSRGLDNQPAYFPFEFSQHMGVVLRGSLARLDYDLFGSSDRLLGFLLLQAGGRTTGFLDELGCLSVGLGHHLLALGLGPRQLGFYFLGIG